MYITAADGQLCGSFEKPAMWNFPDLTDLSDKFEVTLKPDCKNIIHVHNRYIATTGDHLLTSVDGQRWHLVYDTPDGSYLQYLKFVHDRFFAFAEGIVMSPDGVNWQLTYEDITDCLDILYTGREYIAYTLEGSGSLEPKVSSVDGVTWTEEIPKYFVPTSIFSVGNSFFPRPTVPGKIQQLTNGQLFVSIVAEHGKYSLGWSDTPTGEFHKTLSVNFFPSLIIRHGRPYIAWDNDGDEIYYSIDGKEWVKLFINGRFIPTRNKLFISTGNQLVMSNDGISWQNTVITLPHTFQRTDDYLLCRMEHDSYATVDGTRWRRLPQKDCELFYTPELLFAVSPDYFWTSSDDGESWTYHS